MPDSEPKIFPRNLTAHAAYRAAGNPAITMPLDAVANNYPGLELDVRNLDRRFFPGLVFDFVARDDRFSDYTEPHRYGALLRFVDTFFDPDVKLDTPLATKLLADLQDARDTLSNDTWYLDWVEQGGKRIVMSRQVDHGQELPMDGLWVWRIVRSLEPFRRAGGDPLPVKIGLRCRDDGRAIELTGWRRQFTDPSTGLVSLAYQPGELLQSLCSPWQHDFRDCGCHYWASNRPDVVFGEIFPGEPVLEDEAAANPERSQTLLDWMRADRTRGQAASVQNTVAGNRPFQLDHYQISHEWQHLSIVLNNTETGATYVPPEALTATPYASPDALAAALRTLLARLEMAVAIEYLYARFTVVSPEEARGSSWKTLEDDVTFIRHYLLLVAVGEMQHLRWANQLLWELWDTGLVKEPPYAPVLTPAEWVPAPARRGAPSAQEATDAIAAAAVGMPKPGAGWRWRRAALRPFTLETLAEMMAIEHPRGELDESYQRVVATLRQHPYPSHLVELAERVLRDGNDHFGRFRDIKLVLETTYGTKETPYLREVHIGSEEEAKAGLEAYRAIVENLRTAYDDQAQGHYAYSNEYVLKARTAMDTLLSVGDDLAARHIGIPFWSQS